jgi:hypothetical protein
MRRHGSFHLRHEPRRLLLKPWRQVCRCGLGSWPCFALQMLQRQAAQRPRHDGRAPWNGPTHILPVLRSAAPLMTRGQRRRSGS